jgi:Asp-tRNA(Asn)/Glu-tRNA(Gln) amidotransferase A subunit family amidase
MSDLTKLSAVELSSELTKGSVSAVEVTKAHLDRIDLLDKTVQSSKQKK